MPYRLFIKTPEEAKGHSVGDFDSIHDVREDIQDLLRDAPDGTFAYVQRPGGGAIRRIEAWEVKQGYPTRIFTRYGGGQWPNLWSPGWEFEEEDSYRPYPTDPEEREGYSTWKESKEEFIKRGPNVEPYHKPGEHSVPSYERKFDPEVRPRVRHFIERLGYTRR